MQKMINTLTWHPALEAPSFASTVTCLLTLIAKRLDAEAVGRQLIVAISK